ncbi:hypothetical protein J7643_03120 [bacterium]|nr:hypothetical protein [bacterium]
MPPAQHIAAALLGTTLLLSGCTAIPTDPGSTGTNTNSGPGGGTGPMGTVKIGLAGKSFKLNGKTDNAEIVDVWAGTYPVAIFKTPEADTGRIGPGTLEVKRDGRVASMALSDASGKLIRKSAVSLDFESWSVGMVQVQGFVSQLIVDETAAAQRRIAACLGSSAPATSWGRTARSADRPATLSPISITSATTSNTWGRQFPRPSPTWPVPGRAPKKPTPTASPM